MGQTSGTVSALNDFDVAGNNTVEGTLTVDGGSTLSGNLYAGANLEE